jgi:hypothetical protein
VTYDLNVIEVRETKYTDENKKAETFLSESVLTGKECIHDSVRDIVTFFSCVAI